MNSEVIQLPSNSLNLAVLPIREGVLFPQTESVLGFGRELSIQAIRHSQKQSKHIILLTQKNAQIEKPQAKDLYQIGTLAVIEKTIRNNDNISALVRGISRVKIQKFTQEEPFIQAIADKVVSFIERDDELIALSNHLQKLFRQTVQMGKQIEFLNFIKLLSGVNEGEMADQIASTLNIATAKKQQILETTNVKQRIRLIIDHLSKEVKILEIEQDVNLKTQEKFDEHMRESVLRERLRTIQKELGELSDEQSAAHEYEELLKKKQLPQEAEIRIKKEIARLGQMSPNNPETAYIRSWLDLVFDLPWQKSKKTNINIKRAAKVLNQDHYGLEEVKDRVLEHMAVMQLKNQNDSQEKNLPTILCFVGPPGVGKTSIGRSIAKSLNRHFIKISLGGVRDESEIRGHRRTYVGAMPGRIIKGLQNAQSNNPVFMLDEIDKLGQDFHGDPSSALIEVLDPEQNFSFEDHYLDMPYDLSEVLFIATANSLESVPAALLDRLEVIQYSGYTLNEKFEIAKRYLLPKTIKKNALKKQQVVINDKLLKQIIARYTREAGVRDLERQLNKIMRKSAREILEKNKKTITINNKKIVEFLGPVIFDETIAEKRDQVGLAAGLAWTSVGGDILFVEVALSPGKGRIKLTGKLGEVMKESAQAALTYVRAHHQELKIDIEKINQTDVHIHVPEGAVPKDGPSAGVTITTAIVSAFKNKAVRRDVAMTGEITLRGRVLRIGGLKEKAIAAHRAGSKIVVIPQDNERDLLKIPKEVTKNLQFFPVKDIKDVLKVALN
ncbi:MAG: endopeptidase La [Candidatus Pacebacteria bacterium]|nr:endopeptidase La [Candidatus Paceibacterota bacterium]